MRASSLRWTNRKQPLDDAGRKTALRASVFVGALVVFGHSSPALAADGIPGLSAQIQGIVSSTLDTAVAEPSSDTTATKAEHMANDAVALAESVAAQAASSASSISPQGGGDGWVVPAEVAAPSESGLAARARSRPTRPRRPLRRVRNPRPVFRPEPRAAPLANLASAAPPPVHRTVRAASRPQHSAVPRWPRPPGPLPPRPDGSSAGLSGGQSSPVPQLPAALAALLLAIGFEFLPRALPTSAFRKPRGVALLPWHPG
jgi:hypothetical protein